MAELQKIFLDNGRPAFELWITAFPYERSIHRFPDVAQASWPGQYKDISVQLAWEAWQEGQNPSGDNGGELKS